MAEYIRESCLDNEEMKKIFVGGISSDSTDEDLKSFFEGVCGGTVTEHVIIRKDSDKKSHFGFVTFETSELVDEVLLKRGSLKFNGKELEVNRAVPKNNQWIGAHEKTKKLFIANLPKTCTGDELRQYFEARHPETFGTIESIQLIKKKGEDGAKTDENKGYGFVFVTSEDMADKMSIQHSTFQFGGRKIELKKSVPSTESQGGRGRGRGGDKGGMRGRGGGQFQSYGGNYGGGYGGGEWGGYNANAGYGYDSYSNGGAGAGGGNYGYGSGYGASPAPRGRGQGANRFQPY